ncbi:MAG: response regulator with CheY-like receiver domain and winged-helix DNA-binding domain [Erysipelotrichaceae bacterium]|nr:MAG: response regulator with CheY-like receiver domain and winged-helix DNA-binding domain [Erysipelotrichaceae bacterium]
MNLLIADDNPQITSILATYARKEGYNVTIAIDGFDVLSKVEKENFDMILLDVMMPKLDGFQVCRQIRQTNNIPIIMITAKGEDYERIMGLDIGADDYIVKPFSPAEVMARVKAIMRRLEGKVTDKKQITVDTLHIDLDAYKVLIETHELLLTKKEIELLYTLANNPNRAFSRENLLDQCWGYSYYGDSRTVDSHMTRLRSKIDAYDHPGWSLKTVWGVGYKFEKEDQV